VTESDLHTESDLLRQITRGDEAAFTQLFNNYRNKIYSIAFEITESTSTAEEIVQDVFLKIWLKRETLNEITHFQAYLFTITRNYVFTALRRIARNQYLEAQAATNAPLYLQDADKQLLNREYDTLLQDAVNRLPVQQRQVYCLIKEKGYKREEAAAALQLSPETVKTHLAQAMRNIRAYCLARLDVSIALILLTRFH
jgi:RNA polymerase sigma-70 factor (family 1)